MLQLYAAKNVFTRLPCPLFSSWRVVEYLVYSSSVHLHLVRTRPGRGQFLRYSGQELEPVLGTLPELQALDRLRSCRARENFVQALHRPPPFTVHKMTFMRVTEDEVTIISDDDDVSITYISQNAEYSPLSSTIFLTSSGTSHMLSNNAEHSSVSFETIHSTSYNAWSPVHCESSWPSNTATSTIDEGHILILIDNGIEKRQKNVRTNPGRRPSSFSKSSSFSDFDALSRKWPSSAVDTERITATLSTSHELAKKDDDDYASLSAGMSFTVSMNEAINHQVEPFANSNGGYTTNDIIRQRQAEHFEAQRRKLFGRKRNPEIEMAIEKIDCYNHCGLNMRKSVIVELDDEDFLRMDVILPCTKSGAVSLRGPRF